MVLRGKARYGELMDIIGQPAIFFYVKLKGSIQALLVLSTRCNTFPDVVRQLGPDSDYQEYGGGNKDHD